MSMSQICNAECFTSVIKMNLYKQVDVEVEFLCIIGRYLRNVAIEGQMTE